MMRTALFLFCALSAGISAASSIYSSNWQYVPNEEMYAHGNGLREWSAKSLCALATGTRDRYRWMNGSDAGSSISTNYDGFFDAVHDYEDDVPIASNSLRLAIYNDMASLFGRFVPQCSVSNCTVLGYTLGRLDQYNLYTITTASIANPLSSCSGGECMPSIVAVTNDHVVAHELNATRQYIGLPALPVSNTPLDLTQKFFTKTIYKQSFYNLLTSDGKIDDMWEVPIANIVSSIGNLTYSYRGHARVKTINRRYIYRADKNYEYEVEQGDERVIVRLKNGTSSTTRNVTVSTNTFHKTDDVVLNSTFSLPSVNVPKYKARWKYYNGSIAEGFIEGEMIYSRGKYVFYNVEFESLNLGVEYEYRRTKFVENDSSPFLEMEDNPSITVKDQNVSEIIDIPFCWFHYNYADSSVKMGATVPHTAGLDYNMLAGESFCYGDEEFTLDELWDNHEKNPTATLTSMEDSINKEFEGPYTVYTKDGGVLVGWTDTIGAEPSLLPPEDYTSDILFYYEAYNDGLPTTNFSKTATIRIRHMGTVVLESDNLQGSYY